MMEKSIQRKKRKKKGRDYSLVKSIEWFVVVARWMICQPKGSDWLTIVILNNVTLVPTQMILAMKIESWYMQPTQRQGNKE